MNIKQRLANLEQKTVQINYNRVIFYHFGKEPPENAGNGLPTMIVPFFDNGDEWEAIAIKLQDELCAIPD